MNKLNQTESLYAFCGWLTSRNSSVTLGSKHDAAGVPDLIKSFCLANRLPDVRDGWSDIIRYPLERNTVKKEA